MVLIRTMSLSLLIVGASMVEAQQVPAPNAEYFAGIDHNGDGFVQPQELTMWAHAADRDRDGKLSYAEFAGGDGAAKDARSASREERQREHDEHVAAQFALADPNRDGVWDRAEIVAESRRHFQLIDSAVKYDKAGKLRHEIKTRRAAVTEADYLAHHTMELAVADGDKDGRITIAEYMKWQKAAAQKALKTVKVETKK